MRTNFYTPQPLRYTGVQQPKSRTAVPQQPQFSAANIDITEQDFKPLFSTAISPNDLIGEAVQAGLKTMFRTCANLKNACAQANGAVCVTLDRIPQKPMQFNEPKTDLFRIAVGTAGKLNLFPPEELITFNYLTLFTQNKEITAKLVDQINTASQRLEQEQQAILDNFCQDKEEP